MPDAARFPILVLGELTVDCDFAFSGDSDCRQLVDRGLQNDVVYQRLIWFERRNCGIRLKAHRACKHEKVA